MEHRWSIRKRLSGRARLSCPNGAAAQAIIHDLSLGGIGLAYVMYVAQPGLADRLTTMVRGIGVEAADLPVPMRNTRSSRPARVG